MKKFFFVCVCVCCCVCVCARVRINVYMWLLPQKRALAPKTIFHWRRFSICDRLDFTFYWPDSIENCGVFFSYDRESKLNSRNFFCNFFCGVISWLWFVTMVPFHVNQLISYHGNPITGTCFHLMSILPNCTCFKMSERRYVSLNGVCAAKDILFTNQNLNKTQKRNFLNFTKIAVCWNLKPKSISFSDAHASKLTRRTNSGPHLNIEGPLFPVKSVRKFVSTVRSLSKFWCNYIDCPKSSEKNLRTDKQRYLSEWNQSRWV